LEPDVEDDPNVDGLDPTLGSPDISPDPTGEDDPLTPDDGFNPLDAPPVLLPGSE
jgi:hypothetical protein